VGAGEIVILSTAILVAGLVRGITGFAGPLIMVPVLGFFTDTVSAVATSTIVDLSSNMSLFPEALRKASHSTVLGLIGGALLTIPFGGYALLAFDAQTINRTMYAVVGLASLVLLSGWRYGKPLLPRHFFVVGAGSGAILGATSFGIVVLPFLFGGADSASRGRANFILWAFFCAAVGFTIVLIGGRIGPPELLRAAVLIPIYLAGTFIGNRYAGRIDDALLRRIVLVIMLAISIAGVITQSM